MSGPSPICTVGGLTPPQNVTASSSVPVALANPAGAVYWFLQCVGADDTTNVATINASLSINLTAHTATFTAPGSAGSAAIFMSTVGIAPGSALGAGLDANFQIQPSFTTTFKVNVPTGGGLWVLAYNETFEQSATYGNIVEINACIRAGGGGSNLVQQFQRVSTNQSPTNGQSGFVWLCDTTTAGFTMTLPTGSNASDAWEGTLVDSKNKWSTHALSVTTDAGNVPIVDPTQIGGAGGTNTTLTLSAGRASARFKYDKTQGLYLVI